MSQNCSRGTDGVVNYCLPRTNRGRQKFTQASNSGWESPLVPLALVPAEARAPAPKTALAYGLRLWARGEAEHDRAKGPGIPPGGGTAESAGEPPLCLLGVPRGPPS